MLYTKEMIDKKSANECWRDINWYCVDKKGNIGVVFSGGGLLPHTIARISEEDFAVIDNYFNNLAFITGDVTLKSEYLEMTNQKGGIHSQEPYINELERIAMRGLHCFDKTKVVHYYDFEYQAEVTPGRPLTIDDIDKSIAAIIRNTIINIDFTIDNLFHVNDVA